MKPTPLHEMNCPSDDNGGYLMVVEISAHLIFMCLWQYIVQCTCHRQCDNLQEKENFHHKRRVQLIINNSWWDPRNKKKKKKKMGSIWWCMCVHMAYQARHEKHGSSIVTRPMTIMSLQSGVEPQTSPQSCGYSFLCQLIAAGYLYLLWQLGKRILFCKLCT